MTDNIKQWVEQAKQSALQTTDENIANLEAILTAPEKHFAQILKAGLLRAGLSVTELAGKVNVTRKEIYRWLKDNRLPKGEDLLIIIKLLKIAPIFFPELQTPAFQQEMTILFNVVINQEKMQKKFNKNQQDT